MSMDVLNLGLNLPFVDEQYERFQNDPSSVDPSWRHIFENGVSVPHTNGNGHHHAVAKAPRPGRFEAPAVGFEKAAGVYGLVNAYRTAGPLEAQLDPLDHLQREPHNDLDFRSYGFTETDLDR